MSRRYVIAKSLAVLLGCLPLAAEAQVTRATHSFSPADLFSLRHAADVRISPDGHRVAYVRVSADSGIDGNRDDVWLVDVADGRERLIARSASMPRWSPDGRTLAYLADGTHVILQPIAGGASTNFDAPGGAASLRWSPDGRGSPTPPSLPNLPRNLSRRWQSP